MGVAINEVAVRHFRRQGWVRVPALHSRSQIDTLLATMAKGFADPPDVNETYGAASPKTPGDVVSNDARDGVLLTVRELQLYHADVRPVCLDPRVGAIIRALLGADQVRLFSEAYLDKPPGGPPTPWHQDWPLQPFDRRDTVNCWVALDHVAMDQGPLQVVSGSHRLGPLYKPTDFSQQPPLDTMLSTEDRELLWSLAGPEDQDIDGMPVHLAPFEAGDAVIFYGSAVHGAPGNETDRPRCAYSRAIISSEVRYTGMPYLRTDSVGLRPGQPFDLPRYPVFATEEAAGARASSGESRT
ncbi:MAG: phytanoyl-CoA dioxygenase family protein [Acidimicrobiia bacterium]|nr:phytanoyl-CoA dioxygenase family protein [Acidimicrobiia bacterium]